MADYSVERLAASTVERKAAPSVDYWVVHSAASMVARTVV